jgi:hypothetical protein
MTPAANDPILRKAPTEAAGGPGKDSKKTEYIGRLLNLISKQEIRYEGTLVQINSQDQTLLLKNVKSYGSEGRRGKGATEIPPSTQVYEHIIFKASELKDFYVVKSPTEEFQDPAIVSTTVQDGQPPVHRDLPQTLPQSMPSVGWEAEDMKANEREYPERRAERGQRGWRRRSRGGPRQPRPSFTDGEQVEDNFEEEYDFEKMNALFQAGLQLAPEQPPQPPVDTTVKYDKAKSFYDGLSGSKTDPQGSSTSERSGYSKPYPAYERQRDYGRSYGRGYGQSYDQGYDQGYDRGYDSGYGRRGGYNVQRGEYRYRPRGQRYRRAEP